MEPEIIFSLWLIKMRLSARMQFEDKEKKGDAYNTAKLILREYPDSYESKEAGDLLRKWE